MALNIHFLNVGKGSCTVVNHPSGRLSVIDIDDSRARSDQTRALTDPLDYLNASFPGRNIFRFILTHPDMDHMSGIKDLFASRKIWNFWDFENKKVLDEWDGSPYDEEDWIFYKKLRSKSVPGINYIRNTRGKIGNYWSDDGIEILHPHNDLKKVAEDKDDYDHVSHVLKINYAGRSVLLCGDATPEALEHIHNDTSVNHMADVILAPGHGSKNHVHEDMLTDTAHSLTIISVADDVEYDEVTYSAFGPILATKDHGNIVLRIEDDGDISCRTQWEYNDQWYAVKVDT